MNPRHDLRSSICIYMAVAIAISYCVHSHAAPPTDTRPNVLFIAIDDLNDWVSCLDGHPQASTPHLDALAKRGVLFTNAHCQAPICNPSRTSFMNGVLPSTSGIYDNNDRMDRSAAIKQAVSMPRTFAKHGYVTLGTGKLFHASSGKQHFMQYGPAGGQGPLPKQRISVPAELRKTKLWDWGPYPARRELAHDDIDARWAAQRLAEKHAAPLFLALGFYRPHVPMYAPKPWFDARPLADVKLPAIHEGDRDDLPAIALKLIANNTPPPHDWFVKSGKWKSAVQAYLASTSFMDDCLGQVIAALDKGPNAHNTWVVVFSDHGFSLGEKEHWAKRSLWENDTRVPMIIVPPKSQAEQYAKGKRCDAPVGLIDLYPTLVELCALPTTDALRKQLDGRSLAPLLKKPDAAWPHPAITTFTKGNHTVRSQRWRYTRYADGSEELYDHKSDKHEWHNLARGNKTKPEHAAVMADHRKWLPKVNAEPPVGGKRKPKGR